MKIIRRISLSLIILGVTVILYAQDSPIALTESYTHPTSGINVKYPDGWVNVTEEIDGAIEEGTIIIVNSTDALRFSESIQPGDMIVQVASPALIDPMVGGLDFEEAWSILVAEVLSEGDTTFDITEFDNHARLTLSVIESYVGVRGIIEVDEGVYSLIFAQTHPDTIDDAIPIFYDIAGQVTYEPTIFNTLFESLKLFQNTDETFMFTYPDDPAWVAYEEDSVAIVTNAGGIEDFTADDGQYLIAVSAVPAEEADEQALFTAMLSGLVQNMEVPLPPLMFRADGSETQSLTSLGGLVGQRVGSDYTAQTAIIAPQDKLPEFTVSTEDQSPLRIVTEQNLVAIISVYGATGAEDTLPQMIELIAGSLSVPIDLSTTLVSDIPLPNIGESLLLTVDYPEDWETFERGGFNVIGILPNAQDAVRLIMSGRPLESGETVEDALQSFITLFGYQIFDTIELRDGRIVYIGTNIELTEAVLEVEYQDDYVVTMSFLPANENDYFIGLPVALAILESIELKLD